MQLGKVKWFDAAKGYGFVRPDAGGSDVFLHMVVLRKVGLATIANDVRVEFEVAAHPKTGKPRVVGLRVLEAARSDEL